MQREFESAYLTSVAKMLISLTVGKVDAGVAVLLTEDKRLVCDPSQSLGPAL